MAYTQEEIDKLNRTFGGTPGVIYEGSAGNFIATDKGNLILLQSAESTRISTIANINSNNTQGALVNLAGRMDTVETTYATDAELTAGMASTLEQARCNSIAMALIL